MKKGENFFIQIKCKLNQKLKINEKNGTSQIEKK